MIIKGPVDENRFKKLLKAYGYSLRSLSKHHEIVNEDGEQLMTFAIDHGKGKKRQVKPYYVRKFIRLLKERGEIDE